jgi:ppGpp synthetase/RelA/SpoT-type nucleotidyltranferase
MSCKGKYITRELFRDSIGIRIHHQYKKGDSETDVVVVVVYHDDRSDR